MGGGMKWKRVMDFDTLPKGYGWNLRQKIQYALGLKDGQVHINTNPHGSQLLFEVELTSEQESLVEGIMADPEKAQLPPEELMVPGNTFVVKDLYEYKKELEMNSGYPLQVYYKQSGRHGDIYDEIFVIPCDSTYTCLS
jgi:hypothetical protein